MHTNDWSSEEDEAKDPASTDAQKQRNEDDPEARIAELEAGLLAIREEQLRERAELDNQRKRMTRDLEQARKFANERLLGDLLSVIDSLERGLDPSVTDLKRMREGTEITLRQLIKVADDHGLKAVDPTGEAFNPEHHQAMSLVDSPAHKADSVVQVMQKGYLLNGRLLRPAMVAVAKG